MKTLHASALLQLLKKGKIQNTAELLTLIGTDTDVTLLLRGMQAELDRQGAKEEDDDDDDDAPKSMRAMMRDVFRFACLHYPEQAEEYLRELRSEFAWKNILNDDGDPSGTAVKLMGSYKLGEHENEKKMAKLSIIDVHEQRVTGKVLNDHIFPALCEFFNGRHGIEPCETNDCNDNALEPFNEMMEGTDHFDEDCHIPKVLGPIPDEDSKEENPLAFLAENFEDKCINTRHTGKGKGAKKLPDWIDFSELEKRIQSLSQMQLIITRTEDSPSQVARGKGQYYPERWVTFSMPIPLLGLKPLKGSDSGDKKSDVLKYAKTVAISMPMKVINGKYQMQWAKTKDRYNTDNVAYSIKVTSCVENDNCSKWHIQAKFEEYYGTQFINKVRKLMKESKKTFSVAAPEILVSSTSTPILEEILKFHEAKQAAKMTEAPAQSDSNKEVPANVSTQTDGQAVPSDAHTGAPGSGQTA